MAKIQWNSHLVWYKFLIMQPLMTALKTVCESGHTFECLSLGNPCATVSLYVEEYGSLLLFASFLSEQLATLKSRSLDIWVFGITVARAYLEAFMLIFFLTFFLNQFLSSLPGYSFSVFRQINYFECGIRTTQSDVFLLNRNFGGCVSNQETMN